MNLTICTCALKQKRKMKLPFPVDGFKLKKSRSKGSGLSMQGRVWSVARIWLKTSHSNLCKMGIMVIIIAVIKWL